MKTSPTERWNALTLRERWMLAIMAVAVFAFVYWFAALRPLQAWAADARERHQRALAESASMPAYVEAIGALPPGAPAATPDAGAIADSARAIGLDVLGVEAEGATVRLRLGPASPDLLFAWLEQQRLAGQGPRTATLAAETQGVRATLAF